MDRNTHTRLVNNIAVFFRGKSQYLVKFFERWYEEGKFRNIKYFYKYLKIFFGKDIQDPSIKNKIAYNLATLEIFYKVLDEWFPGNWDICPYIEENNSAYHGNNIDSRINFNLFIYFPELEITASQTGETYKARGILYQLTFKIYPDFRFLYLQVGKFKYYVNELMYSFSTGTAGENINNGGAVYIHSHCNSSILGLNSYSFFPFYSVCTGSSVLNSVFLSNRPPLVNLTLKSDGVAFKNKNKEIETYFNELLNAFVEYISCESHTGVPYMNFWKLSVNKLSKETEVPLDIDIDDSIKTLFRLMFMKDSFDKVPSSVTDVIEFSDKSLYEKVRDVMIENEKIFNKILVVKTVPQSNEFTFSQNDVSSLLDESSQKEFSDRINFFRRPLEIKIGNNVLKPFVSRLKKAPDVSEPNPEIHKSYLQVRTKFYNIFKNELKTVLNEQDHKYLKTY